MKQLNSLISFNVAEYCRHKQSVIVLRLLVKHFEMSEVVETIKWWNSFQPPSSIAFLKRKSMQFQIRPDDGCLHSVVTFLCEQQQTDRWTDTFTPSPPSETTDERRGYNHCRGVEGLTVFWTKLALKHVVNDTRNSMCAGLIIKAKWSELNILW